MKTEPKPAIEMPTPTALEPALSDRIRSVLLPHLRFLEPNTELNAEDSLAELGLDSLASINLLFDLETEFDIQISDDVITDNSFTTLFEIEKTMREALG
ncbi:MAG: phosphopantetheine-binding protein [Verrucomicrobiota bacterium]